MSDREKTSADFVEAPADDGPVQLPATVGPGWPPVEHRFKAGNPGRPKGSRNKLGEAFVAALHADFAAHGAGVIERVRLADPGVYLRVIARVVPQTLLLHEDPVAELSDEELTTYLLAVREAIQARGGGGVTH